jgi:hypothetical protein
MIQYLGHKQVFITTKGQKLLSVIEEIEYMTNLTEEEYIATITLE